MGHIATSQYIVFNFKGVIVKSCDSLFPISGQTGKNIFDVFPVLKCIEPDVQKLQQKDVPLFLPHVAFARKNYHSICDFVFMRDTFASHDVIVWMITDNARHYQCLLQQKQLHNKNFYEHFSITNKGYKDNFLH